MSLKRSLFTLSILAALSMVTPACAYDRADEPGFDFDLNPEKVIPLAQVDTIEIESDYIASPAKAVVAVPSQYMDPADDTEFPTVYLLHGYDGNYASWSQAVDLARMADIYKVIIVCPDGRDSWYWDSPLVEDMQMESYIVDELVPCIDESYFTILDPEYRAITGLSMGGHGAFWLGMRHPEIFGNIGSMSGGLDITKFPNRWKMDRWIGKYADNPEVWSEYSVTSLVDGIQPDELNIIFDCGTEDFFIDVNNAMDKTLTDRGVVHEYTTRPGKHTWTYWKQSLPQHLQFFRRQFDAATSR